ncbi:hypothetical protein MKX03_008136 [Papaver bracteatum]|nr:hypothetical protein MKX03_008136 [Papaver bracteatum]
MFHTFVCMSQVNNQEGYENCNSNFVCGNRVHVGYPFWGDQYNSDAGSRPEYCGLPCYKLDCVDGDVAEIIISEESYRVLEINTETQVMNITLKDFVDDDDPFPAKYPIRPFESAIFKLAPDADLLTLYFGCSNTNISDEYKFNCQINDTSASNDAYWYVGYPAPYSSSCRTYVSVPVMRAAFGDLITETLPAVIKQGFIQQQSLLVLSSSIFTQIFQHNMCETCKVSGGACGYNTATRIPTCFAGTFIFLSRVQH